MLSWPCVLQDLGKQIDDYTSTYQPEDQNEWKTVLSEIREFEDVSKLVIWTYDEINFTGFWGYRSNKWGLLQADCTVRVLDHDGTPIVLSHRLTPLNTPPLEKGTPAILRLQEILIVGNSSEQVWHDKEFTFLSSVSLPSSGILQPWSLVVNAHVLYYPQLKYSELTLDMFRMLQTLEREPQEDLSNQIYDASPAPGRPPYVSLMMLSWALYTFFHFLSQMSSFQWPF